jgi:hypothetical protein
MLLIMTMGSYVQSAVAHKADNGNISAIWYQNGKHRLICSRFQKIAQNDYQFCLVCPSVLLSICLSVRIWQLGVHWADFYDISYFSKTCQKYSRTTCTLQEDICTFMIKSCWILCKVRDISDKCCRENRNTHFMCIFFKSCRLVNNVENIVKSKCHKW